MIRLLLLLGLALLVLLVTKSCPQKAGPPTEGLASPFFRASQRLPNKPTGQTKPDLKPPTQAPHPAKQAVVKNPQVGKFTKKNAKSARPKQPPPPRVSLTPPGKRHTAPGFSFVVPPGWLLAALPTLGQVPHETRRLQLSRPLLSGGATIDLDTDRNDVPKGKYPLRQARAAASLIARNFGFLQYAQVPLILKGTHGFYESWDAELPGRSPFRVAVAHVYRQGTHYRVGAVVPVGVDDNLGDVALKAVLRSWAWR